MTQPLPQQRCHREAYLGPAVVIEVRADGLTVERDDGQRIEAHWAVAFPYQARRHDRVVLVSNEEHSYIIGVLAGRGVCAPQSRTRLKIHAVAGRLHLVGKRGVTIVAPILSMLAETSLIIAAERIDIAVAALERHVAGRFTLMARDWDDISTGLWLSRAQRLALKVSEALTVQGKTIRIG